ncbi:uncharacterized protein BJ171DRAFT_481064 [Polychytrium aggregatum]|uniref:uncharacterized protein n=1 Tax=Polychytrium aggregatum TaxID=110093 RepID=UPI0022FE1A28|nr:uncharacterized protein BJ171DRAFT_624585 [Polychytrium aggregatum]XP_052961935.1 uncharacterized protein BJ171DRAFT_481064 [Polychytrium aggregatum]KAI9188497.1 hypothetical protein BJ171DRAFT_624585 [Polychytrium aggregatum]KAI9192997.1 hypothetical protein BJ171DRAFT_481064 [Polychytrium aggregatum]
MSIVQFVILPLLKNAPSKPALPLNVDTTTSTELTPTPGSIASTAPAVAGGARRTKRRSRSGKRHSKRSKGGKKSFSGRKGSLGKRRRSKSKSGRGHGHSLVRYSSTKDLNNHHHYRNSVARSGGKKKSRVSVHKQHGRGSGRKSRISRQRGRGSGKKYPKHSKRQPGGKKSSKKRRSSKRKGKRGGNGGCPVDANGRVDFACPICGKTHKLSSNQFHIESIRVPSGDGADRYQSQIVVPVCPGCGTQNLRQFCSSA